MFCFKVDKLKLWLQFYRFCPPSPFCLRWICFLPFLDLELSTYQIYIILEKKNCVRNKTKQDQLIVRGNSTWQILLDPWNKITVEEETLFVLANTVERWRFAKQDLNLRPYCLASVESQSFPLLLSVTRCRMWIERDSECGGEG